MPPDPLASALARISRIVAESLELKEVFARVAETAATVLPFDMMGMGRLEAQDVWSVYAVVGDLKGTPQGFNPDDFSPELRIRPGTIVRIEDAERTLDRRFAYDALILDSGYRSGLRAPLLRRDQLSGAVSVWSRRADAFTEDHVEALRPISSLLGLALEHERLHNLDLLRRRRLEALDALIPALAQALDVRAIFNRVSEIVRPVLPHDRLVLTTLDPDRREVTVDAISGEPLSGFPTTIPAGEGDLSLPGKEYLLISDVEAEPSLSAEQRRRCQTHTTRSILKIPLRLDGRLSTLGFASRTPHQYSDEDVVVARRVADHVSLLMSHQRLAEEERRGAEARQRAARLEEHVEALRNELETTRGPRQVIGESKAWKEVLTYAAKVAPTETTVLLTGESGTGKEVVARLIHRGSPRAKGPFVAINCAALPDTLLESELFGHERGAFTGAAVARPGRIEQAERGVLFLDEVGEMSPAVQAKFLRVLQEREYQRLGGTRPMKADIRVVAATNRDLNAALGRGDFREDLYYRLGGFEIHLPPLRERRDDILAMIQVFLQELGTTIGRPAAGLTREAHDALLSHSWPGNVRELRNVLERATILSDGGLVTLEHLPMGLTRGDGVPAPSAAGEAAADAPGVPAAAASLPAGGGLEAVEREMIVKALAETGNNRSRAARLLGITRSQLYSRLQKHSIDARSTGPDD